MREKDAPPSPPHNSTWPAAGGFMALPTSRSSTWSATRSGSTVSRNRQGSPRPGITACPHPAILVSWPEEDAPPAPEGNPRAGVQLRPVVKVFLYQTGDSKRLELRHMAEGLTGSQPKHLALHDGPSADCGKVAELILVAEVVRHRQLVGLRVEYRAARQPLRFRGPRGVIDLFFPQYPLQGGDGLVDFGLLGGFGGLHLADF